MIPSRNEAIARHLIGQGGLSGHEIARRSGISRATVQAMRAGRRPLDASEQAEQRWREKSTRRPSGGPIERCPHCGRLVEMPCRARQVEELRAAGLIQPIKRPDLDAEEPLTVALLDEDAERYLRMRRRVEESTWLPDEEPWDAEDPTDDELAELEEWLEKEDP